MQPGQLARRGRWIAIAVVATLLGGVFFARDQIGIEWNVASVRSFVDGLGVWGPAVFVVLLALRVPLLLPSKLLLIAGGICFGIGQGTLYGGLGITGSALLTFLLTRWLGIEWIRSQVPPRARRALEIGGTRGGAGLLAAATAYPFGPLTLYHVGAALTSLSLTGFVLATLVGGAVRAWVCTLYGDVLVSGSLRDIVAASVVFGMAWLPLLHPRVRRWFFAQLGLDRPGPAAAESTPRG